MSKQVTPGGRGLGWHPSPPDIRDYMFAPEKLELPESVDLRDGMPHVYDQLPLGACTGNGWAAMVEYVLIKQGAGDRMAVPSRLQIYYDERELEGTVDSDSGAYIRDGAKVLASKGVAHGRLWPYDISKFAVKPPDNVYRDALKFKAVEYARVTQSQQQMMSTLAGGYPIIFGCAIYDSFETDNVMSSGIVPLPRLGDRMLGGHCMVIVGYRLINGRFYWIVRNSWGTGVGDAGYFYMPLAYLTDSRLTNDLWVLTRMEVA